MVTNALGPAGGLTANDGETGHGLYLLTDTMQHIGESGQVRMTLTLEDATGYVTGVAWPEARALIACPAALPAAVAVHATVQHYNDRPQLKVHSLCAVSTAEIACASTLLPLHHVPEKALPALDRLAKLEQELPTPLDGFLREVLLDPNITLNFLTCRASVAHHHANTGGLLVHSTEMLDAVCDRAKQALPDDKWAPHLAQLGYLFHDLGKLRTVGTTCRPRYALAVRHEQLTIELLTPHLRWLELRNPELAAGLRYVFGYMAIPAPTRRPAEYEIARIVEVHDEMSAASFSQRDLRHLLHDHWVAEHHARTQPARQPSRVQSLVQHA